jgi:hypothetical protein
MSSCVLGAEVRAVANAREQRQRDVAMPPPLPGVWLIEDEVEATFVASCQLEGSTAVSSLKIPELNELRA